MANNKNRAHRRGPHLDLLALERICADDRARRELLWIRAKEKGDKKCLRMLERDDPGIKDRLSPLLAMIDDQDCATSRKVTEAYGRLWVECFEQHRHRLVGG